MEVTIEISFPDKGMSVWTAGEIAVEATKRIESLPGARPAPRGSGGAVLDYQFALDEYDFLQEGKRIFGDLLPPQSRPPFELVRIAKGDISHEGSFVFLRIGDDISGMEIGDLTMGRRSCEACGNEMQGVDYIPRVKGGLLAKSRELMTCYSNLRLVCRESFFQAYQRSGLSGLCFSRMPLSHTRGTDLYLVRPVLHEWQDQTGVCSRCHMKTNVRTGSLFNLRESYVHDFELVNLQDDYRYVISGEGVRFLAEHSETELDDCLYPITPGYLEELVHPEGKLFENGEYPTKVLQRAGTCGRPRKAGDQSQFTT